MFPVVICEKYGWTYDEYLDQPVDFIYLISERMSIDAQEQDKAAKK